jgi:hypothetical protein
VIAPLAIDAASAYPSAMPLPGQPGVFGIGLGRTGTTSLTLALIELGYRAVHYPFPDRILDGELGLLDPFDAATDTPIAAVFPSLDARHPGSRFIHTTRAVEPWLRSARKFWERMPTFLDERGMRTARRVSLEVYGCPEFDERTYRRAHAQHDRRVRAYFADRPDDLLTIDLTAGGGWPELCAFLGKPVPDGPFPVANQDPARATDAMHLNEYWAAPDPPPGA